MDGEAPEEQGRAAPGGWLKGKRARCVQSGRACAQNKGFPGPWWRGGVRLPEPAGSGRFSRRVRLEPHPNRLQRRRRGPRNHASGPHPRSPDLRAPAFGVPLSQKPRLWRPRPELQPARVPAPSPASEAPASPPLSKRLSAARPALSVTSRFSRPGPAQSQVNQAHALCPRGSSGSLLKLLLVFLLPPAAAGSLSPSLASPAARAWAPPSRLRAPRPPRWHRARSGGGAAAAAGRPSGWQPQTHERARRRRGRRPENHILRTSELLGRGASRGDQLHSRLPVGHLRSWGGSLGENPAPAQLQ